MNARVVVALGLVAAVVLPSCRAVEPDDDGKPVVFVSVLPQAYFAERVAGDHLEVDVLVGPGQNPHTYEPTPRQMTRLSRARLFLRAGMPFEQTILARLDTNRLRIVDTRQGLDLLESDHAHGHDHGHHHDHHAGCAHHHGEMDPHIWMSPRLAKQQARTMCEAFIEMDPANRADYEANLRQLEADLDALDAEIAEALAPLEGRTFYVFHPAYGYLARDYGLNQEAVEIEGKTPGPRHVRELIDKARAEDVRVIFVEPQFSDVAARTIARQIDGAVVPLDPLAKDYIANLRNVAAEIRDALTPPEQAE